MTVSIAQVVNNTSRRLYYHNRENGHTFNLTPNTDALRSTGFISSSNVYFDHVPFHNSNHTEIWLENGPTVEISDDNWRFSIIGPDPKTNDRAEDWYGPLVDGAQYILRFDEVSHGNKKLASVTILKYEDKYKVTSGKIESQLLQHAVPLAALILKAIFA